MITIKTKCILLLILVLMLLGCNQKKEADMDLDKGSIESKEVTGMNSEVFMDETEENIQLVKKEKFYVLSGLINLDWLFMGDKEQLRLVAADGSQQISLDLQEVKWSKGDIPGNKLATMEAIKLGLTKEIPREELKNSILSAKKDKIAIIDSAVNAIRIFNFSNKKTTTIDGINIQQIKKPYQDNVIFSPQSGYLTLQIVDEKNGDGFISFGADSGKKVHDQIYGVNARWNHQEQSIAFIYRDGDKIGLYQRRNKKISYLEELQKPEIVTSPPQWDKDDTIISYTTGIDQPSNIHLVRVKDKTITRIKEELLEKEKSWKIKDIYFGKRGLVYSITKDEKLDTFKIVGLGGKGSNSYEAVDSFNLQDGDKIQRVNYLVLAEGILYVKEDSVYLIQDAVTNCIIKNKGQINKVNYFAEEELLVFYIEGIKENKVLFMYLKDLL